MTMNNPFFVVMNDSIAEVVESNGDILITRDPAQDQEKQNSQIQEMIDEGVSAIFLNPADWKAVKPALIACKEAGIPVFNIDTHVYDDEYVVSIIASDNYLAGVQCAKDMMKNMKSADIVILNCPQMHSIRQRVQGFKDTIARNDNYKIITEESGEGELEISLVVMGSIIQSGINFNVVMGGNDPSALGALAALQQNHMDEEVTIYGVDGSPDGKNMIKEGFLEGTSAQRPMEIGTTAAKMAYQFLDGRSINKNVIIPVTLITKENLDNFDIDGWQ
jgi:ribose transport system substrate-binding protein